MSDLVTPRSFDPPRRRPVAASFQARNHLGVQVTCELRSPTLIAVVKDQCTGCSEFIAQQAIIPIEVVVITEFPAASQNYSVLLAPEFIADLEARFAPIYLVVSGTPLEVVGEGTIFSAAQVATEIAPWLSS